MITFLIKVLILGIYSHLINHSSGYEELEDFFFLPCSLYLLILLDFE